MRLLSCRDRLVIYCKPGHTFALGSFFFEVQIYSTSLVWFPLLSHIPPHTLSHSHARAHATFLLPRCSRWRRVTSLRPCFRSWAFSLFFPWAPADICDDCCTTLPSVHNLTAVYAVIKAEDPFHVTMGAVDCSDSYQFTDAASQLSLDVPMIENCAFL